MQHFMKEHPDFDNAETFEAVRAALPDAFGDESWRNDTSPRLSIYRMDNQTEAQVDVWIEYADPNLVEWGEPGQISVSAFDDNGDFDEDTVRVFENDQIAEAAAYAEELATRFELFGGPR